MVDGILLMRLEDCATSSRLGMADKGFPRDLARLASLGYTVLQPGGGYKITPAGLQCLKEARNRG
jgi:Mn-dependent DtxR family transcriptional regulator